jgi:5-formyltetrahydrofolate cyclo-ligase
MVTKSMLIVARILEQRDWLKPGSTLSLFGGIRGEPDLAPLIPWLALHQITPVFFGFRDGELIPQIVTAFDQLTRGPFGVFMPRAECPAIEASTLGVILTPGLAFDANGMRLGRGKGHFDKLFARCGERAQRVGICLECQLVEQVPAEAHDVRMHAIVTENRLIVHRHEP